MSPALAADDDVEKQSSSAAPSSTADRSASISGSTTVDDEDQYSKFSKRRKAIITTVISVGAFCPPLSSTMIASALPQVADQYNTSGTIINLSNALYLVAAGISPCFIGPISSLFGRRPTLLVAAICYAAFSLGTGLAPNLAAYFVFRILTAFSATGLLTTGNTCIGDIYHPTLRGTAGGWVLLAFELGPTVGPFLGGVMVTYLSWRTLFYLQAALGTFVTALFVALLPETAWSLGYHAFADASWQTRAHRTLKAINPFRVVSLFRHVPILAAGLGSGALMWNMYSLITPITYVLNPRFGLTSPTQSGLFFLAPGAGYISGALVGGRWADHVVRLYMRRRNGERLPQDRLKSCLPFVGVVGPVSVLLYGWSVQKKFGGIALPVVMMYLQAAAQLFGFLTINPYCLDVMQHTGRSADVVAGNYFIRYMFGAAGIAAALPVIDDVGVGWLSTISAVLLILATAALWAVAIPRRAKSRQQSHEKCSGDDGGDRE